jgi:hypothetical protein
VGAIPFDLFIPGSGRGTLRIGTNAITVMAREPKFVRLQEPVHNLRQLAKAIEGEFGPDCVLIGKAVTLIGQLAREHVFAFHEGASSYVRHSRRFHDLLSDSGIGIELNPILRIRYRTWDALATEDAWLRLPEPLRQTFGVDEICTPSFAKRWREVKGIQEDLLRKLGELTRPIELIRFLHGQAGGAWQSLAAEYEQIHDVLEAAASKVRSLRADRMGLHKRLKELKAARVAAERAKGGHFRSQVFERSPSESDLAERGRLEAEVESVISQIAEIRGEIRNSVARQENVVGDAKVKSAHERRRAIELEAELKRMALIRDAIISSKGLERAGYRPSAWWFPLISPNGGWFGATTQGAEYYFEPLVQSAPRRKAPALSKASS